MMKQLSMVAMAAILVAIPVFVLAQQAAAPAPPSPPGQPAVTEGQSDAGTPERCRDCGSWHDKMVADMKAMDARLDEKVAAMNAAKGDQKVEAMAAVINELVAQRKEMRANVGPMHHGMKYPRMGQEAGMPPDCPMLKQQGGKPAEAPKPAGAQ